MQFKSICTGEDEFRIAAGNLASKTKTIIFDSIEIAMQVEREVDGYKVPLPYVLKNSLPEDQSYWNNLYPMGSKLFIYPEQ